MELAFGGAHFGIYRQIKLLLIRVDGIARMDHWKIVSRSYWLVS